MLNIIRTIEITLSKFELKNLNVFVLKTFCYLNRYKPALINMA